MFFSPSFIAISIPFILAICISDNKAWNLGLDIATAASVVLVAYTYYTNTYLANKRKALFKIAEDSLSRVYRVVNIMRKNIHSYDCSYAQYKKAITPKEIYSYVKCQRRIIDYYIHDIKLIINEYSKESSIDASKRNIVTCCIGTIKQIINKCNNEKDIHQKIKEQIDEFEFYSEYANLLFLWGYVRVSYYNTLVTSTDKKEILTTIYESVEYEYNHVDFDKKAKEQLNASEANIDFDDFEDLKALSASFEPVNFSKNINVVMATLCDALGVENPKDADIPKLIEEKCETVDDEKIDYMKSYLFHHVWGADTGAWQASLEIYIDTIVRGYVKLNKIYCDIN